MLTPTKRSAYIGILTALCFVFTAFVSIPSLSGGHTNLSDAVIFIAAYALGPISALVVGGVGTFFADFFFYPTTMFISLIIHGFEGFMLGFLFKAVRGKKHELVFDCVCMVTAGLFMMLGFFIAKTFIYGNLETALISLYRNALQVLISVVMAIIVIPYLPKTEKEKNRDEEPVEDVAATEEGARDENVPDEKAEADETAEDKDNKETEE